MNSTGMSSTGTRPALPGAAYCASCSTTGQLVSERPLDSRVQGLALIHWPSCRCSACDSVKATGQVKPLREPLRVTENTHWLLPCGSNSTS